MRKERDSTEQITLPLGHHKRFTVDLALEAQAAGVGAIIYTDIATDGMLAGPNFAELDALLDRLDCPLVASGSARVDVRSCPGSARVGCSSHSTARC